VRGQVLSCESAIEAIHNSRPDPIFYLIPKIEAPLHEICSQNTIALYDKIIKIEAFRQDIGPDLIRDIMYIETSHGWYDHFYPWHNTILPINIHYKYWK